MLLSLPRAILSPLAIVLLGMATIIIVIMLFEPANFLFLFLLSTIAFGIRVFIGLVMFLLSYDYGVKDGFLFKGDAYCYGLKGLYISNCYRWNTTPDPDYAGSYVAGGSCTNYDYWCGLIYHHLGESPIILVLINCLVGSLTAIFLYSMARRLGGKKIAVFSSLLAAFWPSLIMWSAQNLKDPLVCFFLVLYFFAYMELRRDLKIHFLPIMALSLLALSKLSIYVAVAALVATCAGFLLSSRKNLKRRIAMAVTIALAVAYFGMHHIENRLDGLKGFNKGLGIFSSKVSIFKIIDFQRRARAEGNLAILPDSDISSFAKAVLYLPLGFVFLLFAPFPWQIGSAFQVMALPEMLIFYMLLPKFVRGVRAVSEERWRIISAPIFFMMIMSLMLALVEGNSGTLFRHRSYILYFAFVFIASGFFWQRASRTSTQTPALENKETVP